MLVHCGRTEGIFACTKRICLRTKDREFLGAEKEKHQNPEKAIARDLDKDFDAKKAAAKGKSYQ